MNSFALPVLPQARAGRSSIEAGSSLIFSTVLGANAASIVIPTIPATFSDLLLTVNGRSNNANTFEELVVQFNGDTTAANYYSSIDYGGNTSGGGNAANGHIGMLTGNTAPANYASGFTATIPAYLSTAWFKTWYGLSISSRGATDQYVIDVGGRWVNTAAISSMTLLPRLGSLLLTGTSLRLYGRA